MREVYEKLLHVFLLIFVFSIFFVGTSVIIWSIFGDNHADLVVEEPDAPYTTLQGSVLSVATSSLKIFFGTEVDVLITKDTKVYFVAVQKVNNEILSQVAVERGIAHIPVGSTVTVKISEQNGKTFVAERVDYTIETDIDAKKYANEFFAHDSYIKVSWVGVEDQKIVATTTSVIDAGKVSTFTFSLPEDISIFRISDTSKHPDILHAHTPIAIEDIIKGQPVFLLLDSDSADNTQRTLKAILVSSTI